MPPVAEVLRLVKEIDLEDIREDAARPFQLLVAAGDPADADAAAGLLSGAGAAHPWLLRRPAGAVVPLHGPCDLAVLVTRQADLEGPLAAARDELLSREIPVVVVVAGSENPSHGLARRGEASRVAVASLEGEAAAEAVAGAVLRAAPERLSLALARHLPPLRQPTIDRLVQEASRANAVYALTAGLAETVPVLNVPLNVADIVVLTKNQLVMSYKVALAAGRDGDPMSLLGEILAVVGSGFFLRQGARQLVGMIPVLGLPAKVAVAYAGTWAIGRGIAAWTKGKPLTAAAMRTWYREGRGRGADLARRLRAAREAGA